MITLLIFLQLMPHIKSAKPFAQNVFGAHLVLAEDIGFMGNFRAKISKSIDFGINGVLYTTPFFGIQGDLNFLIHEKEPDIPFNASFYPLLDLGFGENLFYFSFTGNFGIDFPVEIQEEDLNLKIIPYFLIGIGAEAVNVDVGTKSYTDSSFEAHGSFGTFFVITKKMSIPVEIHFSDEEKGPTGFSFSVGILFTL
ncbi:MAG: hypothetical protein ABIM98_08995 [candidate division WOR-3 bacterium]